MAGNDDFKVKITADTTEALAELEALTGKAKGALGAVLNVRLLAITCGVLILVLAGLITTMVILAVRQGRALEQVQAVSLQQQKLVDEAQTRITQREAAWQVERAAWAKERAAIRTAPQAVRIIEKYIPQLVGQTVTEVPPAQIAPEVAAALPPTPTYVVTTPEAQVETARAVQQGQECAAHVLKLETDGVDLRGQVQAVTKDRDTWRQAARGGSWAKRLFRGSVIGLCGAGGAAVGAGRGSKGAAIGSLVGAVACTIVTK